MPFARNMPDPGPVAAPAPSGPLLAGGLTPAISLAFAAACGAMVANLYYAQSLIALIAPDLKLDPGSGGLIVTLTQLGYGTGLLLIVPLTDLFENRRLVLLSTIGAFAGLAAAASSRSAAGFLVASFAIGVCSTGAQIVVPIASFMTSSRTRGRAIGNIMAGLLAGVMLARPAASFVASQWGWRAIFWISAGLMALVFAILWQALPQRRPNVRMSYARIVGSTVALLISTPLLRRRAVYQGALFAAFNIFWTAAPLMLKDHFHLSQSGIAAFALAGAGGALSAPFAGRLADRGWSRLGSAIAMAGSAGAFCLAGWSAAQGRILIFAGAAVLLDAATQVNLIIGQRLIFAFSPESRGRMNAAYLTSMFLFGASGSLIGGFIFERFGWWPTVAVGSAFGLASLALFASEPRPS